MLPFNNAVIIITGAASGIGQELSNQLAKANAKLVLCDIQTEKLNVVVDQINQSGGSAKAYRLDVTDESAFDRAIRYTVKKFGSIDFLFNNAGIANAGEMQDLEIRDWK